jgi:hypothetical protein
MATAQLLNDVLEDNNGAIISMKRFFLQYWLFSALLSHHASMKNVAEKYAEI